MFGKIEFDIYEREGVISATCTKLELAIDANGVYQLFNDSLLFYRLLRLLQENIQDPEGLKKVWSKYNLTRYRIDDDSIRNVESQLEGPSSKKRRTKDGANLLYKSTGEDSQDELFPDTQIKDELFPDTQINKDTEMSMIEEDEDEDEESIFQTPNAKVRTSPTPTNSIAHTNQHFNITTLKDIIAEEGLDAETHLGKLYQVEAEFVGMIPFKPFIIKPYLRTMKITPFKLVVRSGKTTMFVDLRQEEDLCRFFGIREVEEIYPNMEKAQSDVLKLLRDNRTKKIVLQRIVKQIEVDNSMTLAYWTFNSTLESLLE
ncbi:hypothetical protein JA1_000099 [Spathaspora sp. JA1]|nr:hypothetical protein JA1_000099 [Spathaspora sp. JA1]